MKKQMKNLCVVSMAVILSACAGPEAGHTVNSIRPPAYPLITIDPYTSGWSMTDNLYDGPVRHWTGREFNMIGALRVDGTTYRFMGSEEAVYKNVAGMSVDEPWQGKYTFDRPSGKWYDPSYDDYGWFSGDAAFGTPNEVNVNTGWPSRDIWVRRKATIPLDHEGPLLLKYAYDDDVEIYLDGQEIVREKFNGGEIVTIELPVQTVRELRGREVMLAAHCENTGGDGILDFGLYGLPENDPVMTQAVQKSADVQATRTIYVFECGPVELTLTFTAPLLLDDLELVSRPVNYISYDVRSLDDRAHTSEIYFEASPEWAVNHLGQPSTAEPVPAEGLTLVRVGCDEQDILGKKGDNIRIDWGYFYLGAQEKGTYASVGRPENLRTVFAGEGKLTGAPAPMPRGSVALARSLGEGKKASGMVMVGYDDIYSVQYFDRNLRPYWNRTGDRKFTDVLARAAKDYGKLMKRCASFDNGLMAEATAAGGRKYAELCALAYRQAISAHKLVESPTGDLLWLSKENNSNGSIGTVDISYPSSPMFLYYNPELAKGLMNHIFYYSESGKWTKPFPAHDVGTYPIANGQTYLDDMPVEESGNMLVMTAAVCAADGNADYAKAHWEVLTTWADYLVENGLDPDNQLCTDDFAGHFAHNVNLSAKAIMGIAAYGYLARMQGMNETADRYTATAREMARSWMEMAGDGDHYRLTFDKPGTWSQKYNIVWDKILGMDIFPQEVARTELAYYKKVQNRYGLPLDNRREYTKSDWIMWTATLADDRETFEEFISPVWDFYNETPDRMPMTDWFETVEPHQTGFRARSVVGGYWIKMLEGRYSDR